jgi:hypothetical protein
MELRFFLPTMSNLSRIGNHRLRTSVPSSPSYVPTVPTTPPFCVYYSSSSRALATISSRYLFCSATSAYILSSQISLVLQKCDPVERAEEEKQTPDLAELQHKALGCDWRTSSYRGGDFGHVKTLLHGGTIEGLYLGGEGSLSTESRFLG